MPTSRVDYKLASAVTIGIAYVQVSETDNRKRNNSANRLSFRNRNLRLALLLYLMFQGRNNIIQTSMQTTDCGLLDCTAKLMFYFEYAKYFHI